MVLLIACSFSWSVAVSKQAAPDDTCRAEIAQHPAITRLELLNIMIMKKILNRNLLYRWDLFLFLKESTEGHVRQKKPDLMTTIPLKTATAGLRGIYSKFGCCQLQVTKPQI